MKEYDEHLQHKEYVDDADDYIENDSYVGDTTLSRWIDQYDGTHGECTDSSTL